MLICSCNVLTDKQLREAAAEMRADPNGKIPTPGAVFRHLGCRPRCGGCFPSVIDIIHEDAPESEVKNEKPARRRRSAAAG
ncbi:bacterioferritin-associated ferredoxin [Labrenzia sp. PHM005]|uniref:(2Fe-2S)-binding protein n=1 Tax=Labrenzia sp. PHM005 TaxID=2590016 RepID=UPI0011406E17|nr:(2Fe-2S)-binding protein [Labrenzia sp. PHM005]QDG74527.1 (2Fe-2S)-binding protein [Labrenzia sp. PHM005]